MIVILVILLLLQFLS